MKPPLLCRLGLSIRQRNQLQRLTHRIRGWCRYHWCKFWHNPRDDEDSFFNIDWLYAEALPPDKKKRYFIELEERRCEAHNYELADYDAKSGVLL